MTSKLTQFGLASAFLSGLYDDHFTFKELAEQGDFGHGTFNAIDGEMIALDGYFYRADVDGNLSIVSSSQQTPIATLTHFHADDTFELKDITDFEMLRCQMKEHFYKKNIVYAIRIDAIFQSMLVRSESAQSRPYQPLTVSMPKLQHSFVLENISGTLVGYFVPEVYKSIILSGFHFHFIDDSRTKGGHVFDLAFSKGSVRLQGCTELCVKLPLTDQFDQMDLAGNTDEAFQVAEHGSNKR